jgi:hypothetical protein
MTCPYCGSKGIKTSHKIILNIAEAVTNRWNDTKCGSCGRPFKSYQE